MRNAVETAEQCKNVEDHGRIYYEVRKREGIYEFGGGAHGNQIVNGDADLDKGVDGGAGGKYKGAEGEAKEKYKYGYEDQGEPT